MDTMKEGLDCGMCMIESGPSVDRFTICKMIQKVI
jgi:hypothetical protein